MGLLENEEGRGNPCHGTSERIQSRRKNKKLSRVEAESRRLDASLLRQCELLLARIN